MSKRRKQTQAYGSEIITANTWGRVFWSVFIYREVKRCLRYVVIDVI